MNNYQQKKIVSKRIGKNAQLKRKLQFREYDQKVLDAPKRLITQKKKRN